MGVKSRILEILSKHKKTLAIGVVSVALAGGAVALLSLYGKTTAKVTVEQAILLENTTPITIKHIVDNTTYLYGGETGYFLVGIKNRNREHNITVELTGQLIEGDKDGILIMCLDKNNDNKCDAGDANFTYDNTTGTFSGVTVVVPTNSSVTDKILMVLKDNANPGTYNTTVEVVPYKA